MNVFWNIANKIISVNAHQKKKKKSAWNNSQDRAQEKIFVLEMRIHLSTEMLLIPDHGINPVEALLKQSAVEKELIPPLLKL